MAAALGKNRRGHRDSGVFFSGIMRLYAMVRKNATAIRKWRLEEKSLEASGVDVEKWAKAL